ncbi:hypothetical protein S13b_00081 [Klebsiella phage VLCpiS13b]|uniref:hypothetical protein n=1 Tax=Klebsiella phage VLCpiS13b TaxID=2874886 RepID=UPI00115ACAB2|nr:hypothetical protein [Klebsiella pneumoniae]YP_010686051.1 hypothetical protein PRB92_gp44 [Klebsiella phage VLCpiS13b]UVX30656.1 hypothetical protein S13b_00081 [Klebsiella phage VLCpiS13b]
MAKKLFSSENQPPNKRGKDKRKLLIEALERKGFTEETLYDTIVDMAINQRDTAMMKELIVRFSPLPKPVAPVFEVDFPDDGTPVEKIDAVIRGIASGIIPADIGKMFAEVIKTGLDVAEVTELAARLERLEKLLEAQNG